MEKYFEAQTTVVYTAENLDVNLFGENYYSESSCMTNKWECSSNNLPRKTIMHSERTYIDPETNIMRFQATPGVFDPVNDYYCVAMGEQFAIESAKNNTYANNTDRNYYIEQIEARWGYTFIVIVNDINICA